MKRNKFGVAIAAVAIAAMSAVMFGAYRAASAPLPEGFPQPTPDGEIEIKSYPTYRVATTPVSGDLSQAASLAFGRLYDHISSNDIAMTAPVETRYPLATLQAGNELTRDGDALVSFLYRSPAIVPETIAPTIQIEDLPPMTVVSIGLRGAYDFASYEGAIARLQTWLDRHPNYEPAGPPRRFFYDGPFIPNTLKRSEVQIPIQPAR